MFYRNRTHYQLAHPSPFFRIPQSHPPCVLNQDIFKENLTGEAIDKSTVYSTTPRSWGTKHIRGDVSQGSRGRKFPSGVQGRSPVGGSGGRSLPEGEAFLYIKKIFATTWNDMAPMKLLELGSSGGIPRNIPRIITGCK